MTDAFTVFWNHKEGGETCCNSTIIIDRETVRKTDQLECPKYKNSSFYSSKKKKKKKLFNIAFIKYTVQSLQMHTGEMYNLNEIQKKPLIFGPVYVPSKLMPMEQAQIPVKTRFRKQMI